MTTSIENQAKRVYDHVNKSLREEVMKKFNLTNERFQNQIKDGMKTTGLNAKQMADRLIHLFNETT